MASASNVLICEILKPVQRRLPNISDRIGDVNTQLVAMRGHMNAVQGDTGNIYVKVAQLDGRMMRIEHRFDPVEDPARQRGKQAWPC